MAVSRGGAGGGAAPPVFFYIGLNRMNLIVKTIVLF